MESVRDQILAFYIVHPEKFNEFFMCTCLHCPYLGFDDECECPCLEACPWYEDF